MKKWLGIFMIVIGCLFSLRGILGLVLIPVMLLFNDTGEPIPELLSKNTDVLYAIPGILLVIFGVRFLDKSRRPSSRNR